MSLKTPILLIIFNRPETTRQVFEQIKKAQPEKLFIAADGPQPNKEGEREACEETRKIIKEVDWPCEVKTLFQEKNLGILNAPPTAINWFFNNTESGIILEDDCVPDQSFFTFCEELLEKYRNDERIMQIAGSNFQQGKKRGDASYYFSKYNHLWGWATWKRAWALNDPQMSTFPKFKKDRRIKDVWSSWSEQRGWVRTLERAYNGQIKSWDYPWIYAFWSNSGLCILPNQNLVTNIGFDQNATHTKEDKKGNLKIKSIPLEQAIKHPDFIIANREADLYTFKEIFATNFFDKLKTILTNILK